MKLINNIIFNKTKTNNIPNFDYASIYPTSQIDYSIFTEELLRRKKLETRQKKLDKILNNINNENFI